MPETKAEMDIRHKRTVSVWYVVTTGFLSVFIAIFIGYVYTTRVNHDAKKRTEQQQIVTTRVLCSWADRQADVYADASNPVGHAAYLAWLDLHKLLGCK